MMNDYDSMYMFDDDRRAVFQNQELLLSDDAADKYLA